jgi:hypothetical protein
VRLPRIPEGEVRVAAQEDQAVPEEALGGRVVEAAAAEAAVADSAEAGVEAAVAEGELPRADAIL